MPRYDLPKTAPEPLRAVQLYINSVDLENEADWLPGWLEEHGLGTGELERARGLREALRALVLANNVFPLDASALGVVNAAAARLMPELSEDGRLHVRARTGDAIDEVLAIAFDAMLDGTWGRLKACRNCRWSFYDYSPNRSATWCSMQLCGNRTKTRAYRRRRKSTA
ncbi:MAG TPA: CGNR zinc finger domain-containing protein [Gaiellaceae bacterium]|nr:CGNR zinc finger domain-containing protein [Gaiellaceae bacterium]